MAGSTVVIRYDGSILPNVLYNSAQFESQQSAQPGTFEIMVKDPDRTLGPFITGKELTVDLDGVRIYGGYVTQVTRKFMLPVDILPADTRVWVLRGVDYNVLFDKRVTRRTTDYLRHLPTFGGSSFDGDLIKDLCANYLDIPAGFNTTTHVDNVRRLQDIPGNTAATVGMWKQQGTPWREQMDLVANWSGSVYYIDPDKNLHFHAVENTNAPFGFSDQPNGTTTIGMRDVSATEDGSMMANDALVWGGSEWTEGAVFGRSTNATSIGTHNRWQTAEHHFGEEGYKINTQWRADQIVEGSDEARTAGFNPGLAYAQWNLSLTWYGEDVPGKNHARAGQLVTASLTTMGGALNPITLPMRSCRISFVGVDATGKGHARFEGQLGLRLSDPFSIWAYLLSGRRLRNSAVAAATNQTPATSYGSFGQFEPAQESGLVYKLPNNIGYVAGTTQVYVSGLLMARGVDYSESDPVAGRITFASAPSGPIWVVCRTT